MVTIILPEWLVWMIAIMIWIDTMLRIYEAYLNKKLSKLKQTKIFAARD